MEDESEDWLDDEPAVDTYAENPNVHKDYARRNQQIVNKDAAELEVRMIARSIKAEKPSLLQRMKIKLFGDPGEKERKKELLKEAKKVQKFLRGLDRLYKKHRMRVCWDLDEDGDVCTDISTCPAQVPINVAIKADNEDGDSIIILSTEDCSDAFPSSEYVVTSKKIKLLAP